MGSNTPRATARPALAPHSDSGLNRIPAPFEPPVLVFLSKVPEECQANLMRTGP